MSAAVLGDDGTEPIMSEINMTPLVDVMLVLLIVFMLTLPVVEHAAQLSLPRASSQPAPPQPEVVTLTIDTAGTVAWNGQALGVAALAARIAQAAQQVPQPALRLRADRHTPYERVAQVLSAAQRGGLTKIALVTEAVQ